MVFEVVGVFDLVDLFEVEGVLNFVWGYVGFVDEVEDGVFVV